jgi:hypothetical protein
MSLENKVSDRQQSTSCPAVDGASGEIRRVLAKLYPELNRKDRDVAEANLIRYISIALAITNEPYRSADHLTHPESIPTMKERSIDNLKS